MTSETDSSAATGFNPFENRLCRDIRNELSESLIQSITAGSIAPSRIIANNYIDKNPAPALIHYIQDRITRYRALLACMPSGDRNRSSVYPVAVRLWNQGLFFEVHEWMEVQWQRGQGVEKKIMQGLIQAAGMYVHLEYGRRQGAEKIARKAVSGLRAHQDAARRHFNVDQLIDHLQRFDPTPPKLVIAEPSAQNTL